MTAILAIDPGSSQSAWLLSVDGVPTDFGIHPNDTLLEALRLRPWLPLPEVVVIEKIESYGMAVGAEVFATVHWAGRFTEAARPLPVVQMPRRSVKLELCHSSQAKDANVRQALIDRFGGPDSIRKGGSLYRISKDVWSALAIAVTYAGGAA